jgi:DnaJ family protein C protein 28
MSDQPQHDKDGEQERDAHPLRRVSARAFESLIDQQIREAEAAGLLTNLPGAGKPLDLDDDKDVPDELRVGFRMLKGAGYAPAWIELQKSVREAHDELAAWLARANERWPRLGELDRAALRAEYERKIQELNRQIGHYNLTAPPAVGQLPLLQLWRELRKLGSRGVEE